MITTPYLPQYALGVHCEGDDDLTLYMGSGSFADWLGLPIHFRTTFVDRTSWSTVATPYFLDATQTWLAADVNNYEIISVPLLLGSDTFSTITSGTYDSYFVTLATNILSTGHPDRVIVRLGWEHNLQNTVWSWSSLADPAGYAAAYAHIAAIVKGISPTTLFSWCTDVQVNQWSYPTGKTWQDAYPGDAYVDIISCDLYEEWCNSMTPSVAWANLKAPGSNGTGLDDIVAFASTKGKLWGIEEWSCSTNSGSNGLGDDPTFIDNVQSYCSTNKAFYHCYWNTDLGGPAASVHPLTSPPTTTNVPNAAAEYKTKFGTSTVTTQYLTDRTQHAWTVPAGITTILTIKLHASSGGGGGSRSGDAFAAAGGGSGADSEAINKSVTPGQLIYYDLGRGGRGGEFGTNNAGEAGSGMAWVGPNADGSSPWVTAYPGAGGQGSSSSATTGGAGGSTASAVGSTKRAGLAGGGCPTSGYKAGGGAGSSGATGNGTAGSNGTSSAGGAGGTGNGTAAGGAGGTSTTLNGAAGVPNAGGGAGGGGAYSGNGGPGAAPGGAGGGGAGGGAGGEGSDGWVAFLY
jgi:hypothetical protein